jgi:hypothetical protein
MIERGEKEDTRSLMRGVFSRSTEPDLSVPGLAMARSKEAVPISSSSSEVSSSDDDEVDEEEASLARDGHEDDDDEAQEVAPREEEAVIAGWSNTEQAVARAERSIQVPKSPSVEASSKVKPEGGDATSVVVASRAMGRDSTQFLQVSSMASCSDTGLKW